MFGLATSAGASTTSASPFTAQARALGLSTAQEQQVQNRVTEYLHEVGGTQVALNKIDLDGTGIMLVALPGEATARDLSQPNAAHVCYDGDFCGWSKAYKAGDFFSKYKCNSPYNIPRSWRSGMQGSFWNNQSTGTVAYFYGSADGKGTLNWTNKAKLYRYSYPWGAGTPDLSIVACK
jgi:hypothetical protein